MVRTSGAELDRHHLNLVARRICACEVDLREQLLIADDN
eukprot:CAMPEP_0172683674 /NCGR_PEP_ID=MMETSP1074-20121228/19031_1 /TAXON_ID=2916 /ORGANISM="Ceratium fusus, Strain PA161109" /LENGTH=38 /DNA_ID= /DNA_START= /DNA_END= /DNA_ORIENTATION=